MTLPLGDIAADQSVTVSWQGVAPNSAGVISNNNVSVSATELSSAITHRSDEQSSTVVATPPLKDIYLPTILR